jgi:hypothetical protein
LVPSIPSKVILPAEFIGECGEIEDACMALDPIRRRCVRLLCEGYEAAGKQKLLQLDGTVAEAAGMPYGTRDHRMCVHQLVEEWAAVEEVSIEGVAGLRVYRITEDGFALMRDAGYLP